MKILDGGLGRELARRGAPFRQPEWSALALIEAPETVKKSTSTLSTLVQKSLPPITMRLCHFILVKNVLKLTACV